MARAEEAYENYHLSKRTDWMERYKWPVYCFVAVAFWNMVGAGLLGFLINPPISLYFVQGLNTTLAHGHGALFGVYGMLGIGLMLFCLQSANRKTVWNPKWTSPAFWMLNNRLLSSLMLELEAMPRRKPLAWFPVRSPPLGH